jgi:hypothetical protein
VLRPKVAGGVGTDAVAVAGGLPSYTAGAEAYGCAPEDGRPEISDLVGLAKSLMNIAAPIAVIPSSA